jgi:hypothetical protein
MKTACRLISLVSAGLGNALAHLLWPLWRDIRIHMVQSFAHATHLNIVLRLKRANGAVMRKIEVERACLDLARPRRPAAFAAARARRTLSCDPIDLWLRAAMARAGGARAMAVESSAATASGVKTSAKYP